MTNTHTPGPWTLDETNNGWTLLSNGGEITCEHFDCSNADARLIAAAPEAIQLLIEAYDLWMDSNGDRVAYATAMDKWARRASSLIARATGQNR